MKKNLNLLAAGTMSLVAAVACKDKSKITAVGGSRENKVAAVIAEYANAIDPKSVTTDAFKGESSELWSIY